MVLEILSNIVAFLHPLVPLLAIALVIVLAYVVAKGFIFMKHPNDPYKNKKWEKVYVILTERTSAGYSIVDILQGKWGAEGLYVPDYDLVLGHLDYLGGKKKIFHLFKGVDGSFYPGKVTVVSLSKSKKDSPFFVMLEPDIKDYRSMLKTVRENLYNQLIARLSSLAGMDKKGLFARLTEGMSPVMVYAFVAIIALAITFLLFIMVSDSMTNALMKAAELLAKAKGGG